MSITEITIIRSTCNYADIPPALMMLDLVFNKRDEFFPVTKKKENAGKKYISRRDILGEMKDWPCAVKECKNLRRIEKSGRIRNLCDKHYREYMKGLKKEKR